MDLCVIVFSNSDVKLDLVYWGGLCFIHVNHSCGLGLYVSM